MPANPAITLTTRAECDTVLAALALELRTYLHRDVNITYADENDERQAATIAARLAKATTDVARYTEDLTRTDQSAAELRRVQLALITATAQRDRLALAATAATGPDAYLAEVDGDQIDGQVAILTAAQTLVTNHRATLSV